MICGDFGFQVFGDVIGGRAGVNDHGLVGLDEFGAGAADGFLFRQLMSVARGEGEFVGTRIDQARPAVGPAQAASRFQRGNVAPDGRDGNSHLAGQFFQGGEFDPVEVFLDLVFDALPAAFERFWKYFGRFCKKYLDEF